MKILFVHRYSPGFQMGGADHGVHALISALKDRHEIRVVANAGPFAGAVRQLGVPVIEAPFPRWQTLGILKTLRQAVVSFRPDLIHSHHRYMTFLLDVFLKKQGVPILHTERIQAWDKKMLFRYGHFATAVSEDLTRHLISYYGVPAGKVRTILNAVPQTEPREEVVAHLRKKYVRKKGELFALCTGRFEKQKGHEQLVRAVAALKPEDKSRIKFFLAGDGSLEPVIRREIESAGLGRQFIFLGYVSEIPEYLRLCDFLILPSLWEGLPRVVLEAFQAGRPALATDIPGTREVIVPGKNGLLVPPDDAAKLSEALSWFISHPDEVRKMSFAAEQDSAKYSYDRMVESYTRLYEELSQGRSR